MADCDCSSAMPEGQPPKKRRKDFGKCRLGVDVYWARVKAKHGDKYDYSKAVFENTKSRLVIVCPKHGEFEQNAKEHMDGKGCRKCADDLLRRTPESFLADSIALHGNKYDYSRTVYKNSYTKVIIICPVHGEFKQQPHGHLQGWGCERCAWDANRAGQDDFIRRSSEIHKGKFDYSLVKLTTFQDYVDIICPVHGKFNQKAADHVRGSGCRECGLHVGAPVKSQEHFLERARKKHGNKYDYSKTVYTGAEGYVTITCPVHGDFQQQAGSHHFYGCEKCSADKRRSSKDRFIEKARLIHGDKYNYDKVVYVRAHEPVTITCPVHGDFDQVPNGHMKGKGCLQCSESKGAKAVRVFLERHSIAYEPEWSSSRCRWKKQLKFDFFIPCINSFIEYDGEQHFFAVEMFGGEEGLKDLQSRDKYKNEWAAKNGIGMLRIPYWDYDRIDAILFDYFERKGLRLAREDKPGRD